jgi:hypothetical protein
MKFLYFYTKNPKKKQGEVVQGSSSNFGPNSEGRVLHQLTFGRN